MTIKSEKFNIGDRVSWICRPYKSFPSVCHGTILEFRELVFGSKSKKMGAKLGELYNYPFNKSTTVVALDKLTCLAQKVSIENCEYFDGGTCNNDEEFPEGTPTELSSHYCSEECKYNKRKINEKN
jgi:hypothetical protein